MSALPLDEVSYRLTQLRVQHRDLDVAIARLQEDIRSDEMSLKRLKKRKLHLRDEIVQIADRITPDILA